MKKWFAKWLGRFRQPRWRHGKLSALLMAVFLAACVLLNVGVKVLEDAFGWKRDLSFNSYASTGETTRQVLSQLNTDVELYLLYQSGQEDAQLLELLNRYAVQCDRVQVLPTDIAKNPGILTRFEGDVDTGITADMVIVNCPETNRYEVLSYNDFITQGYNLDTGAFELQGLAYEKELTESILRVTQEHMPTVGFLQGHGELDEDALSVLISLLKSNSYDCQMVSLLAGDTLDGIDLLMFAAPQKDLGDGEVEQIRQFAQDGGSLFVMRDYTDPIESMPNYLALLKSYGVVPLPGVVVAGAQDTGSYYEEQIQLLPYMEQMDLTLSLTSTGMDVLLMPAACAFETPGDATESLSVGTVLKTGPNAYVRNLSDGNASIDQQPDDVTGELTVALYAHRMHANGNVSRLFAAGNSALFTYEYIYQRTYVQQFVLTLMSEMMSDSQVALDIEASMAVRPALTVGSERFGAALIVAVPLLILVMGLLVLLPRRNR